MPYTPPSFLAGLSYITPISVESSFIIDRPNSYAVRYNKNKITNTIVNFKHVDMAQSNLLDSLAQKKNSNATQARLQ